jgi:general L-amino acid transport system substrate-binding protein
MINAEEMGVSSKNVNNMKYDSKLAPGTARLIGKEGNFGKELGLSNDWAYNIILKVGNYGESYERNVGPNTPLKLARGVNALWSQGGILYAAPIR